MKEEDMKDNQLSRAEDLEITDSGSKGNQETWDQRSQEQKYNWYWN